MNLQRRLLATGRGAGGAVTAAVLVGLAGAALAVVQAWLLAHAITAAFLGGADVGALVPTLAALGVVLLARAGLGWGSELLAVRISSRVKADLRARVLAAAVTAGPRLAAERSTARVALLATRGLDALDGYFARYVPQAVLAIVVPVAVVACLAAVDLVAALTVALTVPLIPLFMVLIGRMSAVRRERRWAALGRLARHFADVVAGLPTLRAFGRADAQASTLRRFTDAYRTATMATLRVAFLSAFALELLATLSVALVAVGVGLRLQEGSLGLLVGLFALVLAPEAYLPLRRLGAEFHASEEGMAAAREAFELLDAVEARGAAAASSGHPPAGFGGLRVEGVSVEQPGREVTAPHEVTLEVRPGEVVAVTGVSGSGKSTLLAVLLGFVAPTAGSVLALAPDGTPTDLAALDAVAWRRLVAWVPQTPYLAPGTLGDNVRLGAPDATDEDVAAALASVGLGEVPATRVLGERGRGLSGGERRRLGVARALVRHAPLLLLDEPTAGLDVGAEARVLAAVRAAADAGAAVVLVAHRPGAVAGADRSVAVAWRGLDRPTAACVGPAPAGEGAPA